MKTLFSILVISLFSLAGVVVAYDEDVRNVTSPTKPYALDYCIVSGDKLWSKGDVETEVYKGQEMRFCRDECENKFEKDPEVWMKKYDEAIKPKQPVGGGGVK